MCHFLCLPFKVHPAIIAACTQKRMELEELYVVTTVPSAVSLREMGAAIKIPLLPWWWTSWLLSFWLSRGLSTGWHAGISYPCWEPYQNCLAKHKEWMLSGCLGMGCWMTEADAFDESQPFYLLDCLVRLTQALLSIAWSVNTARQSTSPKGWKSNIADLHFHAEPNFLLQLPRPKKGWWSLNRSCESKHSQFTTIPRSQLSL